MAYTLFCLGTDTVYTPDDNYLKSKYPHVVPLRETLSAIAQYIAVDEHPVENALLLPKTDHHVLHNHATVIDGPVTNGANVDEKIGTGVMSILNAILQGQQIFNLLGFSRGGVETIIIAHEIQRIQTALHNHPQNIPITAEALETIICDSPTIQCKEFLEQYFKNLRTENRGLSDIQASALYHAFIASDDNSLQLNLFALDPVAGDQVGFISYGQWLDSRYFVLPPIVHRYETILQEHERSAGFGSIVPNIDNNLENHAPQKHKTRMVKTHLPGHHASAAGNCYDHMVSPTKDPNKTRHVQHIALYKIYDFLEKSGVVFNQHIINETKSLQYLDREFVTYQHSNQHERRALRKCAYDEIFAHINAYELFIHTAYTIILDRSARKIHEGKHFSGVLNSLFPILNGSRQFVNAEHATLCLIALLDETFQWGTDSYLDDSQENTSDLKALSAQIHTFMTRLYGVDENPYLQEMLSKAELTQKAVPIMTSNITTLATAFLENNSIEQEDHSILSTLRAIYQVANVQNPAAKQAILDIQTNFYEKLMDMLNMQIEETSSFAFDFDTQLEALSKSEDHSTEILTSILSQAATKHIKSNYFNQQMLKIIKQIHFGEKGETIHNLVKKLSFFSNHLLLTCAQTMQKYHLTVPAVMDLTPFGHTLQTQINILNENALLKVTHSISPYLDKNNILDGISMQILGYTAEMIGLLAVSWLLTALLAGTAATFPLCAVGVASLALCGFGIYAVQRGTAQQMSEHIDSTLQCG